jgi:hypothetical protein
MIDSKFPRGKEFDEIFPRNKSVVQLPGAHLIFSSTKNCGEIDQVSRREWVTIHSTQD